MPVEDIEQQEAKVAVVIRARMLGETARLLEGYDQTVGRDNPSRILHVCTPIDEGFEVTEVWESEEALDRFLTKELPPIWEAAGMHERMSGAPSWTITPVHHWTVHRQPEADAASDSQAR